MQSTVVVVGLGEIGNPLFQLLKRKYRAVGVDMEAVDIDESCDIMHVCYPYDINDFVKTTVDYMEKYGPRITVINSTVAVGTTRKVFEKSGKNVVHSPIRGKHARMEQDLMRYTKYIGGHDEKSSADVAEHFSLLGMKTKILPSPETTELAKLTSTTYFGLLIAWAQEVERYCRKVGVEYEDVISLYEEVDYFPKTSFFPGVIGGHCIMPNIGTLKETCNSFFLDSIEESNRLKMSADKE